MQSTHNESPALRPKMSKENSDLGDLSSDIASLDSVHEVYGPTELYDVVHYFNKVPPDYLVHKQNYMVFRDFNNDMVYIDTSHDYKMEDIRLLLDHIGSAWSPVYPSDYQKFKSLAGITISEMSSDFKKNTSNLIKKLFETLDELKDISLDSNIKKQLTRIIDIIYMTYTFFQNKTFTDYSMWIVYWISNLVDKKYLPLEFISLFNEKLSKAVSTVCSKETKFKSEAKNFTFSDNLLDFKNNMDTVLDSSLYNSLYDAVSSLISWNLLPPHMAKLYFKSGCKPIRSSLVGLFANLLDSMCETIKFLRKTFTTGDWKQALRQDDPTSNFLYRCDDVISRAKYHYDGDEDNMKAKGEFNFHTRSIMNECRELIDLSDEFKKTKGDVREMAAVYMKTIAVKEVLHRLQVYIVNEGRTAPYAFLLHGLPGVGKSVLSSHMIHLLLKELGYPPEDRFVHSKNLLEKYWSGYNPSQHVALKLSEVGTDAKQVVKNVGDASVKELLTIIDSILIYANMADLNSKGTTPIRPEIVAIDCNNPEMNLTDTVNNPAAVRRRLLYILVSLKDEFKESGGEKLCEVKAAAFVAGGGMPLDLYYFDIYRMVPLNERDSQRQNFIMNGSIFDLTNFLVSDFHKYRSKQEVAKKLRSVDPSIYKTKDNYIYPSPTLSDFSHNRSTVIKSEGGSLDFEGYYLPDWTTTGFTLACIATFAATTFLVLSPVVWAMALLPDFNSHYAKLVSRIEGWRRNAMHKTISIAETLYLRSLVERMPDGVRIATTLTLFGSCLALIIMLRTVISTFRSENLKKTVNGVDITEVEGAIYASPPAIKKRINGSNEWTSDHLGPHLEKNAKRMNNRGELISVTHRNRRYFKVISSNNSKHSCQAGWILGSHENYFLISYHYLLHEGNLNFTFTLDKTSSSGLTYFQATRSDFKRIGGDLALGYCPALHFHDIRHMFTSQHPIIPLKGYIDGEDVSITRLHVKASDIVPDINSTLYSYKYEKHKPGSCGMPLFAYFNNQTFVSGIHCGYSPEKKCSIASPLFLKNFDDGVKQLANSNPFMPIYSDGPFRLNEDSKFVSTHSYNSETNWVENDKVVVHGQIHPNHSITPKSRLQKNPMRDEAARTLGLPVYDDERHLNYDVPMMKRGTRNGVYCSPVRNWFEKVKKPSYFLKPKDCLEVVHEMHISLLKSLAAENHSLKPVTQKIAINGSPENFYIRSMNMSTSGGVLFPGGKRKYFEGEIGDLKPTPFLQSEVDQIIQSYRETTCAQVILGAQLKDEPRSREKCLNGKTRVFAMSPVSMTIVQRMVLLPFYSIMMHPKNPFYSRIGINMHSAEVDRLYWELKQFSPMCIEGDYGGFDTSMPFQIGHMACTLVMRLCRDLGFNDEALKLLCGIMSDNLHPTLNLEGDIFSVPGFQPSGKYATAEDNSLRGLILLYFAYRKLVPHDCSFKSFKKNVRPAIYGDDVIAAVKPSVAMYFNNITYGKFVKEVYGMEFTPADKTSVHTRTLIPVDEVSFLKRTFRYSKLLKRVVAPLDISSLAKTFTWVIPSSEESIEQQCTQMCCSYLREIFFHIDTEKDYLMYYAKCCSLLTKLFGDGFGGFLPTFQACKESSTQEKLVVTIPAVEKIDFIYSNFEGTNFIFKELFESEDPCDCVKENIVSETNCFEFTDRECHEVWSKEVRDGVDIFVVKFIDRYTVYMNEYTLFQVFPTHTEFISDKFGTRLSAFCILRGIDDLRDSDFIFHLNFHFKNGASRKFVSSLIKSLSKRNFRECRPARTWEPIIPITSFTDLPPIDYANLPDPSNM